MFSTKKWSGMEKNFQNSHQNKIQPGSFLIARTTGPYIFGMFSLSFATQLSRWHLIEENGPFFAPFKTI